MFIILRVGQLTKVLPGVAIDTNLEHIVTKQDDKRMRDLFRKANQDLKTHGQLLPNTINDFEKTTAKLETHKSDEKEVSSVEGVLLYAK